MANIKIGVILLAGIIIGSSVRSFDVGKFLHISSKVLEDSAEETFVGEEKMKLAAEIDLNSPLSQIGQGNSGVKTTPKAQATTKVSPKPTPKSSDIKIPEIKIASSSPPTSSEAFAEVEKVLTATSVPSAENESDKILIEDALDHAVIYAVQIAGETSSNDFVVIINPKANDLNVSGWKLRKRTSSGSESSVRVFPEGSSITAGKYFIWANSKDDFNLRKNANVWSTQTLAANNSIALMDKDGSIVDAVGWGDNNQNPFSEGNIFPSNPEAGKVLVRKISADVPVDTNNNLSDFEIK